MKKLKTNAVVIKIEETPDPLDRITLRVGPYPSTKSPSAKMEAMHTTVSLRALRGIAASACIGEKLTLTLEGREDLPEDHWETVCDKCGDHSNSEPDLPCGRMDEDYDREDPSYKPTPCPGTYRKKDWWRAKGIACSSFTGNDNSEPYLCSVCHLPWNAHKESV